MSGKPTTPDWVLAALIVLLPLVFDPFGWQSYLPMKWIVATTLAFIGVIAISPRGFGASLPFWVGVGFLGLAMVVGIDAVDPLAHWIGTPERRLGWLAFLAFFLLFLTGAGVRNADGRRTVVRAGTLALLGLGIHGVLQLLGLVEDGGERVTATMGSAAYLGAVLCLLLPLALGLALDQKEQTTWRVVAAVGIFTGVIIALGSQTRGAWVGLLIAAVVAAVNAKRLKLLVWGGLGALVLVVALSPLGARFLEVGRGDATGRLDEWATAMDVIALDPITGLGFEGYRVAFSTVVSLDYVRSYGRDVVTDRAHNGVLEVGASLGVIGAVVYLVAMVWVVTLGWRTLRRDSPLLMGMGAALIAYVIQQQFLFPLLEVDPIFWGLTGMVWASATTRESREVSRNRLAGWVAIPIAMAILVVGTLGVLADRDARSALVAANAGDHDLALVSARRARQLRPDSFLFSLVEAEVLLSSDEPSNTERALEAIRDARSLAPNDPILAQQQAEVMLELTGHQVVQPAETLETFQTALEYDPNNPGLLLDGGTAALMAGDIATAEVLWLRATDLDPDNPEPLLLLADLYEDNDQPRAAASMRAEASTLADQDQE